jgi:hypothetical protein
MHVPAATVNAEVGEAKAQSLSRRAPGGDHCNFRISFRFRHCRHQWSPASTPPPICAFEPAN